MQYVLVFVIGVSVQRPTENTKQQDYHPMDSGAKNTPVAKEPTRQQQPSQFYTLILHKEKQKLKLSGNKVVMPEHKTKVMQLKSRTCFVPILVAHTGAYPGAKETSQLPVCYFCYTQQQLLRQHQSLLLNMAPVPFMQNAQW